MSDLTLRFTIVDSGDKLNSDIIDLFNRLSLNENQVDVRDYLEDLYTGGVINYGRKVELINLHQHWSNAVSGFVYNIARVSEYDLVNVKIRKQSHNREIKLQSEEMLKRNVGDAVTVGKEVLYIRITVRV